jgi:hypothetical protein
MFGIASITFICMLAVSFAFVAKPFARSASSSSLAMSFYDISEKDATGIHAYGGIHIYKLKHM